MFWKITFCKLISTKPIDISTAEKTKKNNEQPNTNILLILKEKFKDNTYNKIHINSETIKDFKVFAKLIKK